MLVIANPEVTTNTSTPTKAAGDRYASVEGDHDEHSKGDLRRNDVSARLEARDLAVGAVPRTLAAQAFLRADGRGGARATELLGEPFGGRSPSLHQQRTVAVQRHVRGAADRYEPLLRGRDRVVGLDLEIPERQIVVLRHDHERGYVEDARQKGRNRMTSGARRTRSCSGSD